MSSTSSAPSAQPSRRSRLDCALRLAAQGFRVFPLKPGEKTPAVANWPKRATRDEKQIQWWWKQSDYNIGVACGRGLMVLDYDMKPGQGGAAALAAHEALDLVPPESFRVRTASGRVHV
jgi:hypothetical protein